MSITKLLYGDCMEWLPKLPKGQISLVLADLPYNITDADYDKNVIPLPDLWQQYKRILQPGGIVALFASQPFTTKLINSNLACFKYCWYWDKVCTTGALFAKVQPMRRIEEILIFQKPIDWLVIPEVKAIQEYLYQGKERAGLTAPKLHELFNSYMYRHYFTNSQWTMIPERDYRKLQVAAPDIFTLPYSQMERAYRAACQRYKLDNGTASMRYFPQGVYKLDTPIKHSVKRAEIYKKNISTAYQQEYSGYPSNVIQITSQTEETANNKRVHPSQKPVALLEYIIKTYTQPGEIVVDNTMGSGSTGVAAINTGRGFIGIELDGVYYNAAVKRIKEAKQQQQETAKGGTDGEPDGRRVTESDTPQKEITLGSLFDGLGGWQLAAIHNGVKPLWSSEIEAFPMAITKKHFPDTLQLGDITKLDGATLPLVDIICAGSPCQDLSISGKRKGLEGERSGLFRKAIDIVHGMREATKGQYPKFFIWENVPGAFSSNKGADFQAVLEEISKSKIPMPNCGRWAEAGMVRSGRCDIAWRVLDAQFWGVPQRRKRIFLIADFREKQSRNTAVLFESESMPGNNTPGGKEGRGTAAGVKSDIGATSSNTGITASFYPNNSEKAWGIGYEQEKSATLRAEAQTGLLTCDVRFTSEGTRNARRHVYKIDTSRTLDTSAQNPDGNYGGVAIVEATKEPICIGNGQMHQLYPQEKVGTLTCMHEQQAIMYKEIATTSTYGALKMSDKVSPLRASGGDNGGGSENYALDYPQASKWKEGCGDAMDYIVRRLTPVECERLQGLPDNFTNVECNGKPASDSARYKAIGNGMAQPCADFVLNKVAQALRA